MPLSNRQPLQEVVTRRALLICFQKVQWDTHHGSVGTEVLHQHTSTEWLLLYLWLMDADLMACIKYVIPYSNQQHTGILPVSSLHSFYGGLLCKHKPHCGWAAWIPLPYGRADFANNFSWAGGEGAAKGSQSPKVTNDKCLSCCGGVEGTEHLLGPSEPKMRSIRHVQLERRRD